MLLVPFSILVTRLLSKGYNYKRQENSTNCFWPCSKITQTKQYTKWKKYMVMVSEGNCFKEKNASFCALLKKHFGFAFDNAGNSGSSLNLIWNLYGLINYSESWSAFIQSQYQLWLLDTTFKLDMYQM